MGEFGLGEVLKQLLDENRAELLVTGVERRSLRRV